MSVPVLWNEQAPNRCPNCNNVTDPRRVCRWHIVECCRCRCEFTRVPEMAWMLRRVGVVCPDHKPKRKEEE